MRKGYKILLVICVIVFVTVLFLLSPYFYVTESHVTGCETLLQEDILDMAGLDGATNLLMFNTRKARENIMTNLYVDNVTFIKTLPNTLTVTVKERRLSGYVEYLEGQYLYIDESGRVLAINSFFTEKLPVVGGLKFNSVRLGELLEVENQDAFKTVVTYAALINKYELADMISRIDVSETDNTRILLNHIDFNVGDEQNADEKVRTVKEIILNMPNAENMKGFVDLREVSDQYFFKILV